MAGAKPGSFFSQPDYKNGVVNLILARREQGTRQVIGACGYSWVTTSGRMKTVTEAHCTLCYEKSIGCFTDWGKYDHTIERQELHFAPIGSIRLPTLEGEGGEQRRHRRLDI